MIFATPVKIRGGLVQTVGFWQRAGAICRASCEPWHFHMNHDPRIYLELGEDIKACSVYFPHFSDEFLEWGKFRMVLDNNHYCPYQLTSILTSLIKSYK